MAMLLRMKFEDDLDYEHETPSGAPLPGSKKDYDESPIMELIDPKDDPETGARRPVPYHEYVKYWGNPERHRAVIAILERQCAECHTWHVLETLGGIDLMDDHAECRAIGRMYTGPQEFAAIPGYLGDVARELISDHDDSRQIWRDTTKAYDLPADRAGGGRRSKPATT